MSNENIVFIHIWFIAWVRVVWASSSFQVFSLSLHHGDMANILFIQCELFLVFIGYNPKTSENPFSVMLETPHSGDLQAVVVFNSSGNACITRPVPLAIH